MLGEVNVFGAGYGFFSLHHYMIAYYMSHNITSYIINNMT